jgi:hypothetical protein
MRSVSNRCSAKLFAAIVTQQIKIFLIFSSSQIHAGPDGYREFRPKEHKDLKRRQQ